MTRMRIEHASMSSKKTNSGSYNVVFTRNLNLFCKNTILHGFKYMVDKELYPLERIFFGLAFATVIVLSGVFIYDVWRKWNNTPVLFGTNPLLALITQEPFPAVTICNLNVAFKSKAEKFSIYSTEYAKLQMLCKREVNTTIANSISDWNNLNNFLTEIAQPCSNMFVSCRFGSVKYNCTELFRPVITDKGLCCVFNSLHPAFIYKSRKHTNIDAILQNDTMGDFVPVDWSSESGYQPNLPKHYTPRPAVGAGENLGLTLVLDVESKEYYCSSSNSVGFKILIHSPMKRPSLGETGILLAPGQETKIRISAEKFESDEKLRNIHYSYRQCFFQSEGHLSIYSKYTQSNCESECFIKLLLKYCGCIAYFLPLPQGNESLCSIHDATCVEEMRINSRLMKNNVNECKRECLSSCHDINYYQNIFSAPLKHDGLDIMNSIRYNISKEYVEENIAVLHFYHDDVAYRSFKQTLFFTGTDALSSIGGLISLFFGFGFMSLAELMYFAVVKLFRRHKNSLCDENSQFEIQTDWKKPVRKRHMHEIALSPYRKLFRNHTRTNSNLFKRKWYRKRQVIASIDNSA